MLIDVILKSSYNFLMIWQRYPTLLHSSRFQQKKETSWLATFMTLLNRFFFIEAYQPLMSQVSAISCLSLTYKVTASFWGLFTKCIRTFQVAVKFTREIKESFVSWNILKIVSFFSPPWELFLRIVDDKDEVSLLYLAKLPHNFVPHCDNIYAHLSRCFDDIYKVQYCWDHLNICWCTQKLQCCRQSLMSLLINYILFHGKNKRNVLAWVKSCLITVQHLPFSSSKNSWVSHLLPRKPKGHKHWTFESPTCLVTRKRVKHVKWWIED